MGREARVAKRHVHVVWWRTNALGRCSVRHQDQDQRKQRILHSVQVPPPRQLHGNRPGKRSTTAVRGPRVCSLPCRECMPPEISASRIQKCASRNRGTCLQKCLQKPKFAAFSARFSGFYRCVRHARACACACLDALAHSRSCRRCIYTNVHVCIPVGVCVEVPITLPRNLPPPDWSCGGIADCHFLGDQSGGGKFIAQT